MLVFLQNQTGSLGSFLPLLMGGGVVSALGQKDRNSPGAWLAQPQPEPSRVFAVNMTMLRGRFRRIDCKSGKSFDWK